MALQLLSRPLEAPIRSLIVLFILWKSLLLVVATCSPGPGYDTSTNLSQQYDHNIDSESLVLAGLISFISGKLTRWDAIYFTTAASRGYLYEQEWAFGWGFSRLIAFFSSGLKGTSIGHYNFLESFVGISIAHVSHGLSVLALYGLTRALFPERSQRNVVFITACLHILTPGGLFLSAPYGESTLALLNFTGAYLFVCSHSHLGYPIFLQDISLLLAGIVFGIGCTVRSNGILNGLLFLEETARIMYSWRTGITFLSIRRLVSIVAGGLCIGVGFLVPQYIAYREFCQPSDQTSSHLRVWCQKTLPSIYSFVQERYWNVGFLRYWVVSNIPLFILAAPMLIILITSAFWTMSSTSYGFEPDDTALKMDDEKTRSGLGDNRTTAQFLRSLAAPQFLLAVLAITNYHVQIITRISSGYCIWYIWLASKLVEANKRAGVKDHGATRKISDFVRPDWVVKFVVLYALIQGGLFSSFLPPA